MMSQEELMSTATSLGQSLGASARLTDGSDGWGRSTAITVAEARRTGMDVIDSLETVSEESLARLATAHAESAAMATVQAAALAAVRVEAGGRSRSKSSAAAKKTAVLKKQQSRFEKGRESRRQRSPLNGDEKKMTTKSRERKMEKTLELRQQEQDRESARDEVQHRGAKFLEETGLSPARQQIRRAGFAHKQKLAEANAKEEEEEEATTEGESSASHISPRKNSRPPDEPSSANSAPASKPDLELEIDELQETSVPELEVDDLQEPEEAKAVLSAIPESDQADLRRTSLERRVSGAGIALLDKTIERRRSSIVVFMGKKGSLKARRESTAEHTADAEKAAEALAEAMKTLAGASEATTTGKRRMSVSDRIEQTGKRGVQSGMLLSEALAQEAIHGTSPDRQTPEDKVGSTREVSRVAELMWESSRNGNYDKWKVVPKSFEAPLCSFQELVNVENHPMLLSEALERYRNMVGGQNFTWEKSRGAYGGQLNVNFPISLWYQHSWAEETKKSRTSSVVSFLHKPGCVFIYQPIMPFTMLRLEPKHIYRPMFEQDPRSFHIFKLAWRHFLDFSSTDYRAIVGEQLERWTQRCRAAIEKPFNATYWLMLMVGSHYRETLSSRRVVKVLTEPSERVPVICIDSFVALSALLFSPERQVLFAGVDPTPSYLRWLQYVADQNYGRKDTRHRHEEQLTVFEMNEVLDLPAIIIFYGRPQLKAKESDPCAWVSNPVLVKSYIARYAEDNRCASQLELATRLYTYSSAVGLQQRCEKGKVASDNPWYCWNGLRVCEIGVPMPNTQASFLSPFLNTRQVATYCPVHGLDAATSSEKKKGAVVKSGAGTGIAGGGSLTTDQENSDGNAGTAAQQRSRMSFSSSVGKDSHDDSEVDQDNSDEDGTESTGSHSVARSWRGEAESRSTIVGSALNAGAGQPKSTVKESAGEALRCTCGQYMHQAASSTSKKAKGEAQPAGGDVLQSRAAEMRQALSSIADYDLMHIFVAILSGGLNLAKMVIRLHFSIDTHAYDNLPEPACSNWQDSMMPWYREFNRTDVHCRSRYGMLLGNVLRGLLGDGFTSGLHDEALDILRTIGTLQQEQESAKQTKFGEAASTPGKAGFAPRRQNTSINLTGIRRPSLFQAGHHRGSMVLSLEQEAQSSPAAAAAEANAAAEGKKEKLPKSIIGTMQVWCELVGTESPVSYKVHFEVFNQWCHSAHLMPFLLRCYRRFGIAGLAPGQHVGGHKHGTDPFHPLVLPTVPDFCYGHCYPLHKVLQYFYGGTEQIVCSIDDVKAVELQRASLSLIPGQERLNNQCWFQVDDPPAEETAAIPRKSKPRASRMPKASTTANSGKLDSAMLQLLQASLDSPPARGGNDKQRSYASRKSVSIQSIANWSQNRSIAAKQNSEQLSKQSKLSQEDEKNKNMAAKRRLAPAVKRQVGPLGPGQIRASDNFFWFCHGDFSMYTYPANQVPRNFLQDPLALKYHYSDFVSRSGTPVRRPAEACGEEDLPEVTAVYAADALAAAPPSICLCQPTELTAHTRARWDVQMEFADEDQLLLGDAGWFPGALGHRFTFEAKTNDVQRYVLLNSMPQASLVYMEHVRTPKRDRKKDRLIKKEATAESSGDESSGSKSDEMPVAAKKWGLPYFYGRSKHRQGSASQQGGKRVDLMLPPLLAS